MNTASIRLGAAGAAALLALTLMGTAHAQKTSREIVVTPAASQGPRGLLSGKPSPQVVQRADGSQEIESDESMLHTMVLVRQADGSMKQICVHNAETARRLAAGLPVTLTEHSHDR